MPPRPQAVPDLKRSPPFRTPGATLHSKSRWPPPPPPAKARSLDPMVRRSQARSPTQVQTLIPYPRSDCTLTPDDPRWSPPLSESGSVSLTSGAIPQTLCVAPIPTAGAILNFRRDTETPGVSSPQAQERSPTPDGGSPSPDGSPPPSPSAVPPIPDPRRTVRTLGPHMLFSNTPRVPQPPSPGATQTLGAASRPQAAAARVGWWSSRPEPRCRAEVGCSGGLG